MSAFCGNQQERALLPTETLFQYRGHQRYISMEERIKTSPTEEVLQSHSILDEQFSIILKKTKQHIHVPSEAQQEDSPLVYLLQEVESPLLFQKTYKKYCWLSDFVFGREEWGRMVNCLRIGSDLISRLHARLSVNNLALSQSSQQLLADVHAVIALTHYSSSFRKLSKELWKKIAEYAQESPLYLLRDCGSRNGTFLMDFSMERASVKAGEGYQFENRDYIIYVNQVLHENGNSLSRRLIAFQQHWRSQEFYNPRYSLRVVCPPALLQALPNLKTPVHAIHFQADFTHQLKYFFWIISSSEHEAYTIGEGQTIAVSPSPEQLTYDSGRHGALHLESGRWRLYPSYAGERLWVKLPAQKDYQLNPSKRYRIRLGHMNIVDLAFHNFA